MARKLMYNDEEGGMAKAQLQKIEMYAAKLNEMIHPEDELEGWVQNKLSVVAAYMGDVKHYLDYALQNEPEYKEFANGGMMDKPRYWEVEFTWDAADEESRKVNVMAESVSDAEEQVKKKFGPYYEGLKVVEVEEDKEITWEEYSKRPKDSYALEVERVRKKYGDVPPKIIDNDYDKYEDGGMDAEYFYISGYWKDDKTEFEDYLVSAYDDSPDDERFEDSGIFFYGMSEKDIKDAIKNGENTGLDFVITSYYKADYSKGGMMGKGDSDLDSLKKNIINRSKKMKVNGESGYGGYVVYLDGNKIQISNYKDLTPYSAQATDTEVKVSFTASNGDMIIFSTQVNERLVDSKSFEKYGGIKYIFEPLTNEISEEILNKIEKYSDGGMMRYEGSTEAEDFKEAEEYIGKDVWETLSKEDKLNATQYLKAKGVIGYAGQEEEIADFMASQYAKGGSLYRGFRPSPSISATAYPRGFKMIGNDGNMWEIALDSRGVHRWKRTSTASSSEKKQQDEKLYEAIQVLESVRGDVDVEDELKSLKKLYYESI